MKSMWLVCRSFIIPSTTNSNSPVWNGIAEKIVVARIDEVLPHPNADRLVLCKLNDGKEEHIVLTGAPNLYPV